MLEAHPNLYLSLKMLAKPGACQVVENRPLNEEGEIWPEWETLIKEFRHRIVLGADDGALNPNGNAEANIAGTWALLEKLPDRIALLIACDNPRKIYNLD